MENAKALMKADIHAKRILSVAMMVALVLFLFGCSTTQDAVTGGAYFERLTQSIAVAGDFEYTSMDIDIPAAYGNIPPHPDDPGSSTRKVDLKSGSYLSMGLGVDFSPLPFETFENLKLGYKAVLPLGANNVREGLSDMEWYEYGAYAGTYSRVELPLAIHSLRLSWRQPIARTTRTDLFVEGGLSYDFWRIKIQGGWDRNYDEEPMLEDTLSSKTINPFVVAGLEISDRVKIGFFWKPEKIKGSTKHGDVDIRGNTYGLTGVISF